MQVVILAAGMGKRLKNKTANHTKAMVEFLGKTFLEHSLDKLTKFDISRIVLVVGYHKEEIINKIGNSYNNTPVIYVENKDYQTTNNIYSLYLAKKYLREDDTLLLESDLIFEEKIIEKLLKTPPQANIAVVDKFKPLMEGTVVQINKNDEIISLITKQKFDFNFVDTYYKTVNIYKFSKNFMLEKYLPFLEAYCLTMGKNSYYELVLKVILSLETSNLQVLKLEGEKWYEIDDLKDYDIAKALFNQNSEEKYKDYTQRFGGNWVFSGLKDFCLLVNPYFPTDKFYDEIKYDFKELISSYSSTQSVQRTLIANTFNVDEHQVITGNGAAELINVLLKNIEGNIGVIVPTFEEYIKRVKDSSKLKFFTPNNPDFHYTKEDLKTFSKEISTLILVNPDNPSGNLIEKNDLIELIEYLKLNNKNIIIDESFIDFSNNFEQNTLLNSEILNKYPNLIVIKSLSKSYGIAGIRLGIMASANQKILSDCLNELPVWNINSFGEYFLQILNKYKEDYKKSCKKIIQNREELFEKLSEIKFLRPVNSSANYIMCEVKNPYKSSILCHKLIEKNILIKNLENKKGFQGRQYIRIAVKSKEDNQILIDEIKNLTL